MGKALFSIRITRGCLLLLTVFIFAAFGQAIFPDSFYFPVTYYDYHTNPNLNNVVVPILNTDFETQGYCSGRTDPVTLNMVMDTLSSDRKPILKTIADCNDHLNDWFRPSGACSPSDLCIVKFDPLTGHWSGLTPYIQNHADPNETFPAQPNEWMYSHSTIYPNMNNVVIYDSLLFKPQKNHPGTYYFQRDGKPDLNTGIPTPPFLPIDNRGFGPEGHDIPALSQLHPGPGNFSFAMEMHQQFTYFNKQHYVFEGDDDVWVFINGKLVTDLGGRHAAVTDSFNLDDLAPALGMIVGHKYWLDFFYAQRQTNESAVRITTNMLLVVDNFDPLHLRVSGIIGNCDTGNFSATVYDNSGLVK
ncbi:MAG: fibro-slime domain-containing protein, partial [Chitinivibrionales bacterium]|nr:fibro-slime domain-containing protein [Chitinivibrionales bacterium]